MSKLRYRQIHLDFHTSELIPGIGSEFVAEEFVETLQRAHVDSVTLFSRCHHGMIYHDTRFPARHPHLTCNLLAKQIEACHKADIRAPIYITVGWDEWAARNHPEWLQIDSNGRCHGAGPLEAGWKTLCFASPYIDYVIAQTEEVLEMFGDEVDGLFFDIIHQWEAHSVWCMERYAKLGLDPKNPSHVRALKDLLVGEYRERINSAVRAKNKTCTLFHNSGHVYPSFRPTLHTFSHLEVESLPSGGWGYAHFPTCARYARKLDKEFLGMTGKFAKSWGHFNGYKTKEALEYECFNMLALNGKCSVGDQLPPSGRLDAATYDLIGSVYSQVAEREPWCRDAEPVTEIALFSPEAIGNEDGRVDSSILGAYRMLQEGHHQFDIVDGEMDISGYSVLILPDKITLTPELAVWVGAFLESGGSVIASYKSGLDVAETGFVVTDWPCTFASEELPFSPDFLQPIGALADGLASVPNVCYERGLRVTARADSESLATLWEPYFNRTRDHFCSHAHAPVHQVSSDPAVLRRGRVIYFAHPVFVMFARHGVKFYKQIVLNALASLLPEPLVQTSGPTTLHVTLNRQPAQNRLILHLLHYIPERRTLAPDTIEDVIPLYRVPVRMRASGVRSVTMAPSGEPIPFSVAGGYVEFVVPEVVGHAMAAVDLA